MRVQLNLRRAGLLLTFILLCPNAQAHSFGKTFTLPLPFWMVAWGSAVTLVLTFVVMAWRKRALEPGLQSDCADSYKPKNHAPRILQNLHLLLFMGVLVAGIWGSQRKVDNIIMTYFWVWWMLGVAYASVCFGPVWRVFSPIQGLLDGLQPQMPRPLGSALQITLRTMAMLALLALYVYEFWGDSKPRDLAFVLCGYSAVLILGGMLSRNPLQFAQCLCPFQLQMDTLARCKPLANQLQKPFSSLTTVGAVLILISAGLVDGLRDTEFWLKTLWPQWAQWLAQAQGQGELINNPLWRNLHYGPWLTATEILVFLTMPVALLTVLSLVLKLGHRWASREPTTVATLLLQFAPSLIPIAAAYGFSHYFTLILTQGLQIVHLASDPAGLGWNLLSTRDWLRSPLLLDAQWIWGIQTASVLLGHVWSAIAAHRLASSKYPTLQQANLSQLPLLTLMIALTLGGLWILSQPLQIGS